MVSHFGPGNGTGESIASVAVLGSRHWEQDGWERGQEEVGWWSYCYE